MKRTKQQSRRRIHLRVRKKVSGTPERPRLCVYRSNKSIYCQIIDDLKGHTLVAASSHFWIVVDLHDYHWRDGGQFVFQRKRRVRTVQVVLVPTHLHVQHRDYFFRCSNS
jgi:hypothetical protein